MTEIIQYAVDALTLGCLYALLACGLALVFSVAGIANFSFGALIMVGAYVLSVVTEVWWPVAVVVVVGAVTLVSLASHEFAFKPLRHADATTLLVASFAVSLFIESVMLAIVGPRTRGVDFEPSIAKALEIGSVSTSRLNILIVVVVALTLGILTLMLRRTYLGMQLRAASEDFTMAQLVGIRANRVIAAAFVISGIIAGIASVLLISRSGAASLTIGLEPTLVAFVALVLGGMGSVLGGALGGFALGIVSVALDAALPPTLSPYRDSIVFSLVIVTLLFRPHGLIVGKTAQTRV